MCTLKEDRWAKRWDRCRECGTMKRPHHALGLCNRCYKAERIRGQNHCIDCGAEIDPRSTRCCSCDTRDQWRHGKFDNRDTEEYRRRNAEGVKAAHSSGAYGEEWLMKKSVAMKAAHERGELFSKEHRQKLSEAMARRWASGDMDGIFDNKEWRRKLSEAAKQRWAHGVYDGVFQSPTSIELQVVAALDIMGIEHQPQYRPDGYGRIYDEFVPPNTLIEIQGDYWHGDKRPEQQQRDMEKAQWATENGFEFLVIWEHEIEDCGAWAVIARMPFVQDQ